MRKKKVNWIFIDILRIEVFVLVQSIRYELLKILKQNKSESAFTFVYVPTFRI